MADTEAARLCCQIVKSHFGPLTARIAFVLATRGRLSIPNVIRFSQLKPRTVRAALLVLIQHNLVQYFKSEDDGECVCFNAEECLLRLRFGQFVELARQLHGDKAALVVQALLDHGKLRKEDAVKYANQDHPVDTRDYTTTFETLLDQALLIVATPHSHLSQIDRLMQFEAEERATLDGIPSSKQLREAQEKARIRLKEEDEGLTQSSAPPKPRSLKRKTNGDVSFKKEYYKINYGKFNIHLRSEAIVRSARETFNGAAAHVMSAILRVAQRNSISMSEPRSDPVSITSVIAELDDPNVLAKGLHYKQKQKLSATSLVKEYVGWLAAADNPSQSGRAGCHISLTNSAKVQVEYERVLHRLRLNLLETVVRERHGGDGVRVLRVLLDYGKMDEKHLAKVAMMTNKEVRPLLASMSGEGLITLQDVPKGNDRNPNRTFYLWYVDLDKSYQILTRNVLKTLFNIMLRHEGERAEPILKGILEKCARVDVADNPNLLTQSEREILKAWETKSEKYSIARDRTEHAFFILHDCHVTIGT